MAKKNPICDKSCKWYKKDPNKICSNPRRWSRGHREGKPCVNHSEKW